MKNDKCEAKSQAMELARDAQELKLCQSPFYNQKQVKEVLEDLHDKKWQYEWSHSAVGDITLPQGDSYHRYAHQTKQLLPDVFMKLHIMKYGQPTVGYLI